LKRSRGISELRAEDIDLEAIAWHLGAVVKYRHMDSADGTIVGSLSRAVIAINSSSIPTRQRFSLAHELGHWHHHRGRVLFCGPADIGNFVGGPLDPERQADAFASDLILPGYLVRPKISKLKKISLNHARELAEEFRASLTATLIKILNDNQFPILLVCHGKDRRLWFRRSSIIPEWWFPRDDLDVDTFAFEILHGRADEDAFARKIPAGAWF
jgi:Zn-dependent peptidase ImmA (M78 family)